MTIKRLIILQAVLVLGLGAVFALPHVKNAQPSGVTLALPDAIGEWMGEDEKVTEKEIQTLGPETQFCRKLYKDGRGDAVFVSIVLAGQDMNTSIHRPERCLPAQGWTIADSRTITVPLAGSEKGGLPVTRLHNMRPVHDDNGQPFIIYSLNYYWFVGSTNITASHFTRTWYDIRDRVFKGYNQRWAYVTVAATITEGLQKFGRSEKETDEMLRALVRELAPKIIKPDTLKAAL